MLKMFRSAVRLQLSRFVKELLFTVADEETNQKIFTFKMLKSEKFDPFSLRNNKNMLNQTCGKTLAPFIFAGRTSDFRLSYLRLFDCNKHWKKSYF